MDISGLEIRRIFVDLSRGMRFSALLYGDASADEAELVLIHGGAQNAHTWDLTMAASGRPALAFDLPGHGRSSWYADADYALMRMGEDVAQAIAVSGARPRALIGMSIGGLVALAAARRMEGLEAVVLVDMSPDARPDPGSRVGEIRAVPRGSYEEFVRRVARAGGGEADAKLRHGVWHATRDAAAGNREWRTDPSFRAEGLDLFWPHVEREAPRLHVLLAEHGSFVPSAARARLQDLLPPGRVSRIAGSRHSIQGSQPAALARALAGILDFRASA